MTCLVHPDLVAQVSLATPLGRMRLAATRRGLAGAWFDGQAHHPGPLAVPQDPADPVLAAAAEALQGYWHDPQARPLWVALDLHGTPFQRRVWQALLTIAAGRTCSYAEVAQAAGSPRGLRACGAAIGRNPLSLFVPCHRVIGRDGSLTGYAGGLDRKRALLEREGALAPQTQRPAPAARFHVA